MTQSTSDFRSNANEQIDHAVKVIGRSAARRKVFEAVYHHKTKAKTASAIVKRTKLSRMRVLQEGRHLVREDIIGQTVKDGEVAYEMYDTYHRRKRQVLAFVDNPQSLSKLPTKRKVVVSLPRSVSVPSKGAKVTRISVDDVASFVKVRKVNPSVICPPQFPKLRSKRAWRRLCGRRAARRTGAAKGTIFIRRD